MGIQSPTRPRPEDAHECRYSAPAPARARWNKLFQGLQKMGRSLQLPIAVLPAAGLLIGLGQPGVFGAEGLGWDNVSKIMRGAGGVLLDGQLGLPMLFCVGVAIGMAKKSDGSTALAAVAGFLVYYNVLRQFPVSCPGGARLSRTSAARRTSAAPSTYQNPGVFGGIVMGLMTAYIWQRYHRTRLVDWLGFFNGRRLVPIIMAFVAIAFAVLCLWVLAAGGAGPRASSATGWWDWVPGVPVSSAWPTGRCWWSVCTSS